jgi:hypothetical protein
MTGKNEEPADGRRKNARLARLRLEDAKRRHADERLDDALRQTFPASDALSIVQIRRGD